MALLNCNFCSSVLGKNTSLTVLLPERRHQPRVVEDKKFPVLYALHGLGQDHTNWQRDGFLEHLLKEEDVIVVMPDCERSFYTDSKYGYQYFTYLTEELPLIVGNYFPASRRREDTYIAGISMGGYGALKAAFWRPDLYAAVASLSAAVDPWKATNATPAGMYSCTDFVDNIRNIFGDEQTFHNSENDLFRSFDKMKKSGAPMPRIFMCCGEQDFMYELNKQLYAHIKETGVSAEFAAGNGIHSWDYWNKIMPMTLEKLGLLKERKIGASSLG